MSVAHKEGFALVTVLWIGLLLAVMTASLVYTSRVRVQSSFNLLAQAQARELATAGVEIAADHLRHRIADRRWRADGTPMNIKFGDGNLTISIVDEGGKIDLNRAPAALLQGLFRSVGLNEDQAANLADAVIDWRDADDLRRPNGAEASEYRQAGKRDGPTNRPFQRVDELRRVLGMSSNIFHRIETAVTVHSGRRGIDVSVAPRAALLAIPGIDRAEVDAALNTDSLDSTVQTRERGMRLLTLIGDRRMLSRSKRRVYSVRVQARTANGAIFIRDAVLMLTRRGSKPSVILSWKRGRVS